MPCSHADFGANHGTSASSHLRQSRHSGEAVPDKKVPLVPKTSFRRIRRNLGKAEVAHTGADPLRAQDDTW